MRNLDELECRFVQAALEVLIALEVAIGLLDHDVALEQETLEHLLDVETRVLGVARAQRDIFQVKENRHGGIGCFGRHSKILRFLEPVVIEAYADSLGLDADWVRPRGAANFRTIPAVPRRLERLPRDAVRAVRRRAARRRGHESIQARILEFDAGRALRHLHIVGAAQGRVRMQMQCCAPCPRGMMLTQQSVISSSRPRKSHSTAAANRAMWRSSFLRSDSKVGETVLQTMHRPV